MSGARLSTADARFVALLERIAAGVESVRDDLSTIAKAPASEPAPSPLLTAEQLAELLQVSARTLRRLELSGAIPPAISIDGIKRWRRSTIDRWLSKRGGA